MNSTVLLDIVFCLTNMSTIDRESDQQCDNPNPDVSNVNRYLLNPKSNCNIGTWNVQSMHSTSNSAQVIKEMGIYKLDIDISECRWTGTGRISTKGETDESYTIIYSGQQNTHHYLVMSRLKLSLWNAPA